MTTLSEHILDAPAGEYVDRMVDRAFAHDGTGVLALEAFREMGRTIPAYPERISILFDHLAPANNSQTATLQAELRQFSLECGLHFSEVGEGICHQLMSEGRVLPGEIVVGADSHSCTAGALGAFATGVGATDMAAIWAGGSTWFRVPETTGIHLEGMLTGAAEAKDLALTYVGRLGMDGATYRALEFSGDGAATIPMDGRLTLTNMAIEAGAKTGLFYADAVTREYLAGYGHDVTMQAPQDPDYAEDVSIDLGGIVPVLAVPHRVDTVEEVTRHEGITLDQVFVGTCTNGRYSDIERFAAIVRGQKVKTRTIVVPASREVLLRAGRTGVLTGLIESGCIIGSPGCGPCLGMHMGVLGEGEVALSTANRNFRNRMGVGAEYYLGSVATAAASALAGEIRSPEVVL